MSRLSDADEKKDEKYVYKNKLFDAQMAHESRLQEIKDRRHDAYAHKYHLIDLLRMSRYTFAQKRAQKFENIPLIPHSSFIKMDCILSLF